MDGLFWKLSKVWIMIGFPLISKNCFGIPAPIRTPLPPAKMIAKMCIRDRDVHRLLWEFYQVNACASLVGNHLTQLKKDLQEHYVIWSMKKQTEDYNNLSLRCV